MEFSRRNVVPMPITHAYLCTTFFGGEQKEGAIFKDNVVGPFFFFWERTYQSTESK